MQSENLMKCAHDPCRCLVETEDEFCSEFCSTAKEKRNETCACGHSECSLSEQRRKGSWP